jgi:hypothetical protein
MVGIIRTTAMAGVIRTIATVGVIRTMVIHLILTALYAMPTTNIAAAMYRAQAATVATPTDLRSAAAVTFRFLLPATRAVRKVNILAHHKERRRVAALAATQFTPIADVRINPYSRSAVSRTAIALGAANEIPHLKATTQAAAVHQVRAQAQVQVRAIAAAIAVAVVVVAAVVAVAAAVGEDGEVAQADNIFDH